MSTTDKIGRRAVRQELRSTRSGTTLLVAIIALLVLAYLITEVILNMLGQPPLLATPGALALGATQIGSVGQPLLYAIGGVLTLIGIVLMVRAIMPGIRGLHHTPDAANPTIIDDTVVAAALAKVIRDSANLREEQVSVSVGRRRATAHVHPTTGVPVDREAVQSDAQKVADSYALTPPLRVSVDIDKKGMVG